jgi:hypothetical protein
MNASIADVMEWLVRSAAPGLPPAALAEVFDRLIWCLADNGGALQEVRDAWLRGDDASKVAIALAMDETFPFHGGDRMQAELARIAARWPEHAARCQAIVASWREQHDA